uniref:Uncharacterized protein n=1 Tax=Setaria italica TaxID=4555 RepID=K3YNR9_SETIT
MFGKVVLGSKSYGKGGLGIHFTTRIGNLGLLSWLTSGGSSFDSLSLACLQFSSTK